MKAISLILASILAILAAQLHATVVIVDTFDQSPFSLTDQAGGSSTGTDAPTIGVPGNYRAASLTRIVGAGDSTAVLTGGDLTVNGSNTELSLGYGWRYNFSLFRTSQHDINWNIDGATGMDLTFSEIRGSVRLVFTFRSASGNLTNNIAGGTVQIFDPGIFTFNFSDPRFSNTGLNFSDIDSVLLSFQTSGGTNDGFTLNEITTNPIPEPSSIILTGFSSLLLLRRRRIA
jgi:hypothetical protein